MTDPRRRLGGGLLDVVQYGSSFTLGPNNNEQVVQATAGITVTLPNDMPVGFSCLVEQGGADAVTFAAAAGASLHNRQDFDSTAGQFAVVSLYVRANVGGISASWLLGGDGA